MGNRIHFMSHFKCQFILFVLHRLYRNLCHIYRLMAVYDVITYLSHRKSINSRKCVYMVKQLNRGLVLSLYIVVRVCISYRSKFNICSYLWDTLSNYYQVIYRQDNKCFNEYSVNNTSFTLSLVYTANSAAMCQFVLFVFRQL